MRPWDATKEDMRREFPALERMDAWLAIRDFLRDEAAVADGLRALDTATARRDSAGFESYLAQQEARFGFSPDVKHISDADGIIRRFLFLTYLGAARPMVDLGARPIHGFVTHRVQWVLIGEWSVRAGNRLGPSGSLAELYRSLAHANARHLEAGKTSGITLGDYRTLWDVLFDGVRANASSPEYLHEEYAKARFPGLYGRWR